MPKRSAPETRQRKRWLKALRIAHILFEEDGYHTAYLSEIDQPRTRMARIDLRPTWVGVLDFQTRLPSALGGIS